MRIERFWPLGPFVLLLAWVGCTFGAGSAPPGSAPHRSIALYRLSAHHTCADPIPSPGILAADNPAQADGLWSRCRGRLVLGGGNEAGQRSEIDFDTQRLIYIHMGARRTGGFHLDLADSSADLVDRTLIIPVIWEMPSKNTVVPQMLTHPCLQLAAPRVGYERVLVLDQTGEVRLAANLPAGKLPAAAP